MWMRWFVALLLVFSVLFSQAGPTLAGLEGGDPPHGHHGHHGGHGGGSGAEGGN